MDEWVDERVAEPLTQWGYKARPMNVEDEPAKPAEGAPKGEKAVKAEGKPAKPPTKPTLKAGAANPTPPVVAPPCKPRPRSVPLGGVSAGHF